MKGYGTRMGTGLVLCLLLLIVPLAASAQAQPPASQPPPIGQQLVREGTFALKLAEALEIVATDDEVEAESALADAGIVPRNGWIADYPVTPDIIAELQDAVETAAQGDKLHFERDEALRRFDQVNQELELGIRPYASGDKGADSRTRGEDYPNPAVINNYYYQQGPPVVTYYAPPRDYYYLYTWIPSPFWGFGIWFPGYYILNDFHLVIHGGYRISNHYNDYRLHRMYRIDPGARYRGRTYSGIGVSRPRQFLSTGVPHSARRIFNSNRSWMPHRGTQSSSPTTRTRSYSTAPRGGTPTYRQAPSGGSYRDTGSFPSRGTAPHRGGVRR